MVINVGFYSLCEIPKTSVNQSLKYLIPFRSLQLMLIGMQKHRPVT